MKQAFTMIELIFVIVILGILASIAVPKLGNVKTKAEVTKAVTAFSVVTNDALNNYQLNGNHFADDKGADLTGAGAETTTFAEITHAVEQLGKDVGATALQGVLMVGGESCGTFKVVCASNQCTGLEYAITTGTTGKDLENANCISLFKDSNLNGMFAQVASEKPSDIAATPDNVTWKLDLNAGRWKKKS